MKISIIRYCLICAFLCRGFSGSSETPVNTAYADSLFMAGNYSLAAMEYERIYFTSVTQEEKTNAVLNKSYCYKNAGLYTEAAQTLHRIDADLLTDSLQYIFRYEKALNSYLGKNYYDAQGFLFEIHLYTKDTLLSAKCLFLEILTENQLQNWTKADSLFRRYLAINHLKIDSATIDSLLQKPNVRNPKTAKMFSYVIPGSGQMLSGHIFRGLTSTAFVGSAAAFTILSIKNGFIVSGFTTGLGIFEMLYVGGARYAYYLVRKKNAERISAYNQKICDFLLAQESLKK